MSCGEVFWRQFKHKVPPAYSRADEYARSLNGCRDDVEGEGATRAEAFFDRGDFTRP